MDYYILETIKEMLGLDVNTEDKKLQAIVNITKSRLLQKIEMDTVPEELDYVLIEVSIVRYNRIGSEGVSSHGVDGESMVFVDSDFLQYEDDLEKYLNKKVRFL